MATDPYYDFVVLLTHLDQNPPVDVSKYGHTITVNAPAALDTSIKKFGLGSYLISGTGSVEIADHSSFNLANFDFTIELWIYHGAASHPARYFIAQYDTGQKAWQWGQDFGAATMSFVYSTTGSNDNVMTRTRDASADLTWYHIALSRNGSDLWMYQEGVAQGSVYNIGTDSIFNSSEPIFLGKRTAGGHWAGNLDECRITVGVGRYPDGTSFTPPPPPGFLNELEGQIILPNTGLLNADGTRIVNSNTARRPLKYVGALRPRS